MEDPAPKAEPAATEPAKTDMVMPADSKTDADAAGGGVNNLANIYDTIKPVKGTSLVFALLGNQIYFLVG